MSNKADINAEPYVDIYEQLSSSLLGVALGKKIYICHLAHMNNHNYQEVDKLDTYYVRFIFDQIISIAIINKIPSYYKDLHTDERKLRLIDELTLIKDSQLLFDGCGEFKYEHAGGIHVCLMFHNSIFNIINKRASQKTIFNHCEHTNQHTQEIDNVYNELLKKDFLGKNFRDFSEKELGNFVKNNIDANLADFKIKMLFYAIKNNSA